MNTMTHAEYVDTLGKKLEQLNQRKLLLLGYITVERLLPSYHFFEKRENWGDYAFIASLMEEILEYSTRRFLKKVG